MRGMVHTVGMAGRARLPVTTVWTLPEARQYQPKVGVILR